MATKAAKLTFERASDRKGVLSTLKKIQKFLREDIWIKRAYHHHASETEDGVDRYCLFGAAEKVDGPFELATIGLMKKVVLDFKSKTIEGFNDKSTTKFKDVSKFLSTCIKVAGEAPIVKAGK